MSGQPENGAGEGKEAGSTAVEFVKVILEKEDPNSGTSTNWPGALVSRGPSVRSTSYTSAGGCVLEIFLRDGTEPAGVVSREL